VVSYAAGLLHLTWSCSAHAKDIWTSPDWELKQKLRSATFAVTCTEAGKARLQSLSPAGKPVHLVYHGLKLDRFTPLSLPAAQRDGTDPQKAVRILSVGRAVEKKGFDLLLQAFALLPDHMAWRWTHVGGGPLLPALKSRAAELGLDAQIDWLGAQDQDVVLAQYRQSDLFVLPCRIASDGDRDGLPNVLVEAQSQSLACLSTAVSGITELIEHGRTGMIVPPERPDALASALSHLIGDPGERRRLGLAGAARVQQAFDARASTRQLLDLFVSHQGGRRA
jgi:glycosyltransferase involved in cell wall biosynthesis